MCITLLVQVLFAIGSETSFSLVKRGEICLYRSVMFVDSSYESKDYFIYEPGFCRFLTGETFIVEKNSISFFTPEGEVYKSLPVSISRNAKPGLFHPPDKCVFLNSNKEFGIYDGALRVNLWKSNGSLSKSFIVPHFMDVGIDAALVDNGKLITAGFAFQDKRSLPIVMFFDCSTPFYDYKTVVLDCDIKTQGKKQGSAEKILQSHIIRLSSGQAALNFNTHPDIYLVREDSSIIFTNDTPPHFRRVTDAEALDFVNLTESELREWVSSWSYSNPIREYSGGRLIAPRILHSNFYLDVYAYSEESIVYSGYALTDKPFLFSDTGGIYLLEDISSTSLTIGRYTLETEQEKEEKLLALGIKYVGAKGLSGIKKIDPDTCDGCSRKNRKPRQYCTSLDTVRLLACNGTEYILLDSLDSHKNHILVFVSPQDCGLQLVVSEGQKYVRDTLNYDLSIILTHPYTQELEQFAQMLRNYWKMSVFTNTDKKRLRFLLKVTPGLLMVSSKGIIVSSTCAPKFEPKAR